jgi:hypothetical protein
MKHWPYGPAQQGGREPRIVCVCVCVCPSSITGGVDHRRRKQHTFSFLIFYSRIFIWLLFLPFYIGFSLFVFRLLLHSDTRNRQEIKEYNCQTASGFHSSSKLRPTTQVIDAVVFFFFLLSTTTTTSDTLGRKSKNSTSVPPFFFFPFSSAQQFSSSRFLVHNNNVQPPLQQQQQQQQTRDKG